MKGTCEEGTVNKLFEGVSLSSVQQKEEVLSRTITYRVINLVVKGNSNVIEAFKQYISTHDQQTERFETFPPVICLLLKRYDSKLTKIDDRFEFSEDLDLTTFLTGPDQESKATYTLYVVIAHKGLQYTGHYVSFIKPKGDRDGWYKFDDESVTKCRRENAIDDNFGDSTEDSPWTAYMLMYIRNSELESVLQDATQGLK
ncbi:ubiquitin carboxyl-terminal hydrolase 7-like [Artemia franciscana]|uniref:ubiquitin carboxyl-terminal hydrolase 7-like n=1 Tax=Artemia franciscana TaxID=6661 RepID=UPI0032DB8B66